MDSVGAQPSQASGSGGGLGSNRSRFSNILNPLRKSSTSINRDSGQFQPQHHSQSSSIVGRIPSPGPPQLELSSSPRSPIFVPSISPTPRSPTFATLGAESMNYYSSIGSSTTNSGRYYQTQYNKDQQPIMQSGMRKIKASDGPQTPLKKVHGLDDSYIQTTTFSNDPYYTPYPRVEPRSVGRASGLVGNHQPQQQLKQSNEWSAGESVSGPLVGLGLTESGGNSNVGGGGGASSTMLRQAPTYLVMQPRDQNLPSSSNQSNVIEKESNKFSSSTSSGKFSGGAVMGSGLPSAYTHGGNIPSSSYAPRSGVLVDSLPSSMRFDKEQESSILFSPTSRSWAFRREPYYAGQSPIQPQQQASPTFQQRSNLGSASSSPMMGLSSSVYHPREESRTSSSEDNAHSSIHTYGGGGRTLKGGSTSTSMTSLRDGSYQSKGVSGMDTANRTSHDQRSMIRNPSNQSRLQHRKVDSKSTLNSFGSRPSTTEEGAESDKGKSKYVSKSVGASAGSIRSIQSLISREGVDSIASSPSNYQKSIPLSSVADQSNSEIIRKEELMATGVEPKLLKADEKIPARFVQTLSPIAASSSGETGRLSQSERFETDSSSNNGQIGMPKQPFPPSSEQITSDIQEKEFEHEAAVKNEILTRIEEKQKEGLQEESALRRFTLLQQLHLDELTSHAPESIGWLEPKNGCERVLMPRPTLRDHKTMTRSMDAMADGYQSEGGRGTRQRSAAFERNRTIPTGYQPQAEERDASKNQAILDSDGKQIQDRTISANRPFFHHRMPPEIPSSDTQQSRPAKSPKATQWYLAEERPPIPVRSSSRRGHRGRRHSNVEAVGSRTPALTPNLMSDTDDDDFQKTPDLETVIAQGRALDEERERWREEYRRSIGAAEVFRRKSQSAAGRKGNKHASSNEARKNEPKQVRQSKSSPDLRQQKKKGQQQPTAPMPSPPFATSCLPRSWGTNTSQEDRLKSMRKRSKSLEGFSRFRAAATSCLNSSERRKSIDDFSKENDQSNRRRSKSIQRRQRAMTTSKYEGKPFPSADNRLTLDQPYIIGRLMSERGTSPRLGHGPFDIRHPSWYVPPGSKESNENKQNVTSEQDSRFDVIDQFAAAYSSPRPHLGLHDSQSSSDQQFATAGRYATKKGYHRPSNSDELAAVLHLGGGIRGGSSNDREKQNRVGELVNNEILEESEEERRRLSLGMNRVLEEGGSLSADSAFVRPRYDSEVLMKSKSVISLPVPPRRTRSNSNAGASASSHSRTSMEKSRQSSVTYERQDQDSSSPWDQIDSKGQKVAIPHSPFLTLEGESYMQAKDTSSQTPTLENFPSSSKDDQSELKKSINISREKAPILPSAGHEGEMFNRKRSMAGSILDEQNINTATQRSLSSLGRISSDDTASQHSRELWNTDEHGDEAFQSLFFRKPRPTGEVMSREHSNLVTVDSDYSTTPLAVTVEEEGDDFMNSRGVDDFYPQSSKPSTSRNQQMFGEESKKIEQQQQEEGGEETMTNISHGQTGDTTIERMVGNLTRLPDAPALENFAPTNVSHSTRAGRESALSDNESAWNDSSIGEYFAPTQGSINIGPMFASHSIVHSQPTQTQQPSNIEQLIGVRLGRVASVRQPQIRSAPFEKDQSNSSTRKEEQQQQQQQIDEEAEMKSQSTIDPISYERSLRPRVESFSASVLMCSSSGDQESQLGSPKSNDDDEGERQDKSKPSIHISGVSKTYEEPEAIGFIDFASPAPPRPLSLPDDIVTSSALRSNTTTSSSSNQLEPPASWHQSVGGGGERIRLSGGSIGSGDDSGSMSTSVIHDESPSPIGDENGRINVRRGSENIMNMVRSRVWPTPPVSPAIVQQQQQQQSSSNQTPFFQEPKNEQK